MLGLGQCLVLRSLGLRRLGLRFIHRCGLLAELPGADHVPFMQRRSRAAPRLTYETAATRNLQPDALGADALAPASSAEQGGPAVPAPDVERRVVLADAIVLRALRSLDARTLDLNLRVHRSPTRIAPVRRHACFQITGHPDLQHPASAIASRVHVPADRPAPLSNLCSNSTAHSQSLGRIPAGGFPTSRPSLGPGESWQERRHEPVVPKDAPSS